MTATPVSSGAVSGSRTRGIEPIDRARLSRTWPGWTGSKLKVTFSPAEPSGGGLVSAQPGAEHAGRACAFRCIGRKQVTTRVAAVRLGLAQ